MTHQKTKEYKVKTAILNSVKNTAVRNAGIPSLKGAFEKKVPKELRK